MTIELKSGLQKQLIPAVFRKSFFIYKNPFHKSYRNIVQINKGYTSCLAQFVFSSSSGIHVSPHFHSYSPLWERPPNQYESGHLFKKYFVNSTKIMWYAAINKTQNEF